jgi:lantibiotic transport system permease protein
MNLIRVLHAESLKMKRTLALKLVVAFPAVVVLLVFFMASQSPFSTVNRHGVANEWNELSALILRFWAVLMLPLYLALETALTAGIDHTGNQWKSLFARPVPRWTFYAAKLMVAVWMVIASASVLVCGVLLAGAILPHVQPETVFRFPAPWSLILRNNAAAAGLAFLALAIQQWVSMRWQSFSVGVGTGIVAMIVGFFAVAAARQIGGWTQYFPWSLPLLVQAQPPQDVGLTLAIEIALGLVVAAAGCVDFCRREIT